MTDYEKLKNIVDEIDTLVAANVTTSDPQFKAWKSKTIRFLSNRYGKESTELDEFGKIRFNFPVYGSKTQLDFIEKCREGLTTAKLELMDLLKDLEEENAYEIVDAVATALVGRRKIFIVHGHDGELKEAVARLIEKQGLEAVILSEQANKGSTIIEKFENNSDVGAAILLFTADDIGKSKGSAEEHFRARQNVVFEAGYFMAKLGREHTIVLSDAGVEIPSDMQGVVYTNTGTWQFGVLKELKEMGYSIDFNKAI